MRKSVKKYILEDFEKSYSYTVDKSKLNINSFNQQTVYKKMHNTMLLVKNLVVCSLCLLIVMVVVYNGLGRWNKKREQLIPENFRTYLVDNKLKLNESYYCHLRVNNDLELYIYEVYCDDDEHNIFNYYIVKSNDTLDNCYIIINNNEYLIDQNSFGLLSISSELESNKNINFQLKINEDIKTYSLN